MKKNWFDSYPPNVNRHIDINQYSSIVSVFAQNTLKYANNTAFINMGASITYGQLAIQARDFAAYLQQHLGLKKGDKFAIMMPNVLQYPIALFGALQAGLVVVNVNPLYTPRELEHQLIDAEVKAILVMENFAATLATVLDNTQIKHVITTKLGDRIGVVKGTLINTVVKYIKKGVPEFRLPHTIAFNKTLKIGASSSLISVDIKLDDLAFLQYTGGTTGVAKGAMLTHRNVVANLLQIKAMIEPVVKDGQEFMVTALPLYHIFALTCNCLSFMTLGGTNLLITNPKDLPTFIKTISKYPITAFAGINTLFNGLLNCDEFKNIDFSRLRLTFAGGMATQKSVADRWHAVTGSVVLEGFGLTECAPCVTTSPYNQTSFSGSIGLPLPETDIKLLNEQGEIVAIGVAGELCVKGPQVMKGYFNRPEASNEVLKDGWLATGDIATIDQHGFLTIIDRKKDMIIVSGFNVYPNEIEEIIAMMDDVIEVAAIGVPCEKTGEKVKIFLVTKSGQLNEEAVIAHCRTLLTNYKVPRDFELRDELPKSNVGKVLRKELRQ